MENASNIKPLNQRSDLNLSPLMIGENTNIGRKNPQPFEPHKPLVRVEDFQSLQPHKPICIDDW
jgi:hypothetical protein